MHRRFLQIAALRDVRKTLAAGFAERFGDLQAQAARAAGDERGLPVRSNNL